MWVIWPQKHEICFLRKFGVRERTFLGASELGGGQLPLKSDDGQNPAPGVPQAVVMGH